MSIIVPYNSTVKDTFYLWTVNKYNNLKSLVELFIYDPETNLAYTPFQKTLKLNDEFLKTKNNALLQNEIPTTIETTLRPEQIDILKSLKNEIMRNRCAILACYTGFGKSLICVKLIEYYFPIQNNNNNKIVIVSTQKVVLNQWKKYFEGMNNNVIITSVQSLHRSKKYISCDLMIVDEMHRTTSPKYAKALLRISPAYLIGLSATPYREDCYQKIQDYIFGTVLIANKLKREHDIYTIETGFTYKLNYQPNGKINYTNLITQQSFNTSRNKLIVKTINEFIKQFPSIKWLVIVKRLEQGKELFGLLKKCDIDVDLLLGKKDFFNENCRVLIGTNAKCGVGFDPAERTGLILASDVLNYFEQTLGRIFRNSYTIQQKAVVIEFIDNQTILKRHFKTRCEIYKTSGAGEIKVV